ncbi:hypothetical protein PPYR_02804 [Photinus pyralis]|uniref:Uncharacterized protein n=1 Tax=Photinus pyralis TaxID=7054 RepID=A0A5N4A0Z9_PHOPY|nr:uncharacterized protein LOC116162234 [Photinus pyralis]KAB0791004.1 hypothetical protein PPYR_02804 [Photinus pyralis]
MLSTSFESSKAMILSAGILLLVGIVNCVPFKPYEFNAAPPGYYWREYDGKIPADAFPGGSDKDELLTYIGQIYLKDYGLLPATITPGSTFAVSSSQGKTIQTDKDVKILCSVDQHMFRWVVSKIGNEHLFKADCPLVNGGSEANQIIHIGRVMHEGATIIGRVFSYWEIYKGLWIPHNGQQKHFDSYEILTFNCQR